jgi:predicted nucleotidyltransferase
MTQKCVAGPSDYLIDHQTFILTEEQWVELMAALDAPPAKNPKPAGFIETHPTMERRTVIEKLKAHETELKQLGVEHLYLFGSTARDEADADSDVDLFFDHPEGSLGLYELMDVKEAAARILGCKTDIMTRRSLHRTLRDTIQDSAQQVF